MRPAPRALDSTLACALLLVGNLALLAGLPAQPAAGANPSDWIITDVQTLDNTARVMNGSVLIQAGGALFLRNSTLAFNLSIEGKLNITVHRGASLVVEDSQVLSAQPGLHYNFLVSGHLEIRRSDVRDVRGDATLGGIEIDTSDAVIEDSVVHDNKYNGLFIRSGSPVVRRTTFEANVVAIFVLPGSSPRIEDVVIRNSSLIGLKVSGASPVVRNITISGSGNFGIGAVGSVLDVAGCRITGGNAAIDAVYGTRGTVEGCSLLSTLTGVHAEDSPVEVRNSTFFSATVGVNATRSAVELSGNTFTEVGVGVRALGGVEGAFQGEASGNAFDGRGTAFELLGSSFFVGDNSYAADGVRLRVFHLITITVLDKFLAPVAAAWVNITSALGDLVSAQRTNATGVVVVMLEAYRESGNGSRVNVTPHGVVIDNRGALTASSINATSDQSVRIALTASTTPGPPAGVRPEVFLLILAAVTIVGALLTYKARRGQSRRKKASGAPRPLDRRGPRKGR